MISWQSFPITRRADGSYVITNNGLPYHVPNSDGFTALWAEVDAWAQAHPDQITDEPAPTEAELLARAKTLKTAQFDLAMAAIDAELIRSTTDLLAAMHTPATLAADSAAVRALSADALEQSRNVFVTLRAIQAQNRALRAQVRTAQTLEAVQAIEPVTADGVAL